MNGFYTVVSRELVANRRQMKMKKQLALLISICMIAVSINPMLVTVDSKINTGEEFVELSTEPYENEYGLMANAIELAQMFSLAYEFDKENKAFIIYDDLHGEIMLMHNATKFYSGDRVYPCQPYFYVENDVPMIETGFFCDMFMSSYEYDKDTGKIRVNVGEIREDRAKLIKNGNVMPLYISPFYDTYGLMVSAEDIAKAFGITYKFDGNNAVFDGIYEFEDRAQYFFADGEKIEYYPCFKVEDEMGFIEVGFFADLFGYGYTYDEETHTVEIAEKFSLMGEESPAISGTIQYNGSLEKSTTVEILIQQTALNKESVPTYGGTTGEVIKLGEVTLTPSKPQAQYNFDIYDYATDEYATYTLFYKSETESGYYSRNGGIVPIDVEVETNAEFYPLAEHFSFTSSSSADLKIGKSGIVEGKICIEDGSSVIDESLDVNLILRTRTATRHNYYGNVTYTTGKTYELGTTHFDKGDTTREYSYDTLQYYNADYPSDMIFYELNGLSENIAPAGYYNTDYGFTTLSKIPSKTVYGTSREFNLREYVVADMPLTITSGTTGNIEWSFNRSTGLLTIKGSGEITNEMPWTPYKQEIKSLVIDGTFNIGTDAFAYCSNIKDVEITGPRITFEENVFCYCTSLERAKLDCEITGDGTFNNCTALKEVIVSPTLKVIGERAFLKCSALEKFTIPSEVTTIGAYAFSRCISLEEVKLPDSVSLLGEGDFY